MIKKYEDTQTGYLNERIDKLNDELDQHKVALREIYKLAQGERRLQCFYVDLGKIKKIIENLLRGEQK